MTSNKTDVAGAGNATGGSSSAPKRPRYTLRPVTTPLPSQVAAHNAVQSGMPAGARAQNEDDDGYDPYSDFHDGNSGAPVFEADPWQ